MDEKNVETVRAFFEQKEQLRQERLDKLYQQATGDAEKIIKMIVEEFDPTRVYQWGSLLNRAKFSEVSDIDIGVEGIDSAESFFKMLGKAQALSTFPVDLVEVDKILDEFAGQIRKYGRIVYEQRGAGTSGAD